MKHLNKEIERRTALALADIKQMFDKGEEENSVGVFVSHHLEELGAAYWKKHAGTASPSPKKVLDLLELRSPSGEEDEDDIDIDTFDFTLPGGETDYVLCVRFDENGDIEEISMES